MHISLFICFFVKLNIPNMSAQKSQAAQQFHNSHATFALQTSCTSTSVEFDTQKNPKHETHRHIGKNVPKIKTTQQCILKWRKCMVLLSDCILYFRH